LPVEDPADVSAGLSRHTPAEMRKVLKVKTCLFRRAFHNCCIVCKENVTLNTVISQPFQAFNPKIKVMHMNVGEKYVVLVVSWALCVCLSGSVSTAEEYQLQETRDLIAFVREAAGEIMTKGEKAFPQFREKDSTWFRGDRYIFVLDMEGTRYVYPLGPEDEQKNVLDVTDVTGKPIYRMFIETVSGPGGKGWVHYQWNRPNSLHPTWKSTYLLRTPSPSGKEFIVGCGIYNMRMERAFIVDAVDSAVALLEKQGTGGFKTLRDKRSKFIFKDTYVFVTSIKGRELVNPAFPILEGRFIRDAVDARGTRIVRNYIKVIQEQGFGWVDYLWPKPGEAIPAKKTVYVKKAVIDGKEYVVGAGIYRDWIGEKRKK